MHSDFDELRVEIARRTLINRGRVKNDRKSPTRPASGQAEFSPGRADFDSLRREAIPFPPSCHDFLPNAGANVGSLRQWRSHPVLQNQRSNPRVLQPRGEPFQLCRFPAAFGAFERDQGHGHDFAAIRSRCRTSHFCLVRRACEAEVWPHDGGGGSGFHAGVGGGKPEALICGFSS